MRLDSLDQSNVFQFNEFLMIFAQRDLEGYWDLVNERHRNRKYMVSGVVLRGESLNRKSFSMRKNLELLNSMQVDQNFCSDEDSCW